jgi:hypothetical protein
MYKDEKEAARARMVHGFSEFSSGLADLVSIAFRELTETMKGIDWTVLARLKEADPDLFNWTASGPIRRVQLRRARALTEGKRHGV